MPAGLTPLSFAPVMATLLSNTTDYNGLSDPERPSEADLQSDLTADPRDFHLPTEVLLSIYGHEYFSSHRILWVRNCLMVLYCLFSAVGVLMNVCVVSLLMAWHQKALRNITNTFVLALASSDIVMSGFNMPLQTFYELMETVQFSEVTCRVVFSSFGLPMHISCLVILVIGIDRYWIIIYPLRRRMTRLTAAGMLVLIVSISLISVIPIAVFSTSSLPAHDAANFTTQHYRYCVEYWPSPEVRLLYSIATFLVQFLLPLVLTAILYGRIYIRLHERRFRKRDLERKKRTNKILVGIVVCFFVCWTPWTVFSLTLEVHTYWTQKDFHHQHNGSFQEVREAPATAAAAAINSAHLQKLLLACLQGLQNRQLQQQNGGAGVAACLDYNISVLAPESLLLFGRHTKLIDLLLKLLAMCSSCLNPCLYGCMTETMRMIMKKTMRRMHSFQHWISKLQPPLSSSSNRQKAGLFENYRSDSFNAPVYIMKCCGFQFVIRTGWHQQHEQARNLLDRKDGGTDGACAGNSMTGGGKTRYRPGSGPTGCEAQATPGQSSHEILQLDGGGNPPGQKAGSGSNSSGNVGDRTAHSLRLQLLDPASLSFIHRGSATLSLTEQSTKRTSLLPSSVTEKTPRSSFLVAKAPNTAAAQVETAAELREVISRYKLQQTTSNCDLESPVCAADNQPVIVVCEASSTGDGGGGSGGGGCFDSIQGPTLESPQAGSTKNVAELIPQFDLTLDRLPHLKLVNIEVHVEDTAAPVPGNCSSGSCHNGPRLETAVATPTASNADGSNTLCPVVSSYCPGLNAYAPTSATPRMSLVRTFKTTPGALAPVEEISGYATSNETPSASDTRGSLTSQEKNSRSGRRRSFRGYSLTSKAKLTHLSGLVSAFRPKSTSITVGQRPHLRKNVERRSIWELKQTSKQHSKSISSASQEETRLQQAAAWKEKNGAGKSDESSDDFTHFHKMVLQEAIQNAKAEPNENHQRRSSRQPRPTIMHLGRRISLPWLLRNDSCTKDNPEVRKLS